MINRRTLLSTISGFALFFLPFKQKFYSPFFNEEFDLGRAEKLVLYQSVFPIDLNERLKSPTWRYLNLPAESTIKIEYEHGIETYEVFNLPYEEFAKLKLESWFLEGSPTIDKLKYPQVTWHGYKFCLSTVSRDKNVSI